MLVAFKSQALGQMVISESDQKKINNYSSKFKIILETLAKFYDDSLNVDELSDAAFNALLQKLDPYSKYFTTNEWKAFNDESTGNKVGIGIQLFQLNDTLNIINVIKESSADDAGLTSGDKILLINDSNFIGKPVSTADELLNGEKNTLVKVQVKKISDGKIIDLLIPRKDFLITSVSTAFIIPDTKILYLKLIRFSTKSYEEIMNTMEKYNNKFNSLVLDLKDNQGGSLDQVLKITEEFTSKGDTILMLKSKSNVYDSVYVNKTNGKYNKLPVAVVINYKTASASEIFAGVMQDLDRGIVVGQISTGKGLVQRTWTYTDTSAFRITVAKYYTPSGRLINRSDYTNQNISIPELELLNSTDQVDYKKLLNKYNSKNFTQFKSRKGRKLMSFGGIFPDIISNEITYTKLSNILKNNGFLLSYSLFYYNNNYKYFQKFADLEEFEKNYQVDVNYLNSFITYIKSKKVYDEKMFEKDKEIIITYLKAYIAFYKWGDSGSYRILFKNDIQSAETIKNIDKSIKMIE